MTKNQQEQAKRASDALNESGFAPSQVVPPSGKAPDIAPQPNANPVQEDPNATFVGSYEGVGIPKQGAPKDMTQESLAKEFGKPTLVLSKDKTFKMHFLFDFTGTWNLEGTNFSFKAETVNGVKVASSGELYWKGQKIPLKTFLEPKKMAISNNGKGLLDQPADQPYIVLYRRK